MNNDVVNRLRILADRYRSYATACVVAADRTKQPVSAAAQRAQAVEHNANADACDAGAEAIERTYDDGK